VKELLKKLCKRPGRDSNPGQKAAGGLFDQSASYATTSFLVLMCIMFINDRIVKFWHAALA